MATEFKLPELGENIESGELVRLMITPGVSIAEGEPVMELETDKAVVEVPSSVSGTIGEIRVREGDTLRVGQVIFTVENGAGAGTGTTSASKTAAQPAVVPIVQAPASPVSAVPAKSAPIPAPQPEQQTTPAASAATASEFKLPELGENIDSGDLVRLMISPGTRVSEGQPVMELETDKAVVEVPSTVSGVVREIKVKEGQKVKVGEVIFTLEGGVAAQVEPARRHTCPDSRRRGSRSNWRCALRARRKNKRCPRINRKPRYRSSACRCNWERLPAQTAIRCRRRRTCAVWRGKLAWTFIVCPAAVRADASAKTT
jgi:pyruvate dehydrogenase E2 component (dihydrolipoamide acetyltransferase)